MSELPDFQPSAARLRALLPAADDADLDGRTPCDRYALRELLAHLVGLTAAFRASAGKEFGPLTATDPNSVWPVLEPGWRAQLDQQLTDLVNAWNEPAAWEGVTQAGGTELPAQVMGAVALNEITVHGWDLARALGENYRCDEETARVCLSFASQAAGQDGGPFGPPREIPDGAPIFDRVLALTGRDPSWPVGP